MPRRSLIQGQVRSEIATAERRQLAPEQYGTAVLGALALLVPYDDARFFGVDPGSLLLNRLIAASDGDGPFRAYWLRHLYLSRLGEDYFGPHELMRIGKGAMTYRPRQQDCWGIPEQLRGRMTPVEHTRYFHESRTPVGGSLRLCLRVRGQWIGMIDLVRRETLMPVSERDFAACAELANLIGRGLDAALLREAATSLGTGANAESGVLIVDSDRRIAYATPAGERYLAALPVFDRPTSGGMSTPLLSAIGACAHRNRIGSPPVIHVASNIGPLRIEATRGSDPETFAIVIAPLFRTQSAAIPSHWPLTERQRQVAEKLIQGGSTKSIARDLFVSVPTVETHLGNIYESLGVSGRTDLLARYFRETILLAIDDNGRPRS